MMEIAVWIMAASLFLLAICACAYVGLRISDEIRFRKALDGVDHQENGSIVISRRQIGPGKQMRGSYQRNKAQEWLRMKTDGGGGR